MNNEKLLHLEILVDDKKNAMKKPNPADRKKANQIEKKNKPKGKFCCLLFFSKINNGFNEFIALIN